MRHLTIDNYKDFSEVEEGDRVTFEFNGTKYEYDVEAGYLSVRDHDDWNSIILKVLGIQDPYEFCSNAYHYPAEHAGERGFPECDYDDYDALFRVICSIFEKIKESTKPSNILEEIINPTPFYIKL